jgi:biopolymer transport protein ExbB
MKRLHHALGRRFVVTIVWACVYGFACAALAAGESAVEEKSDPSPAAKTAAESAVEEEPDPATPGENIEQEEGITRAQELIETIKKGKSVGLVLLGVSVLGLAFALERLFRLRRGAIVPAGVTGEAGALWEERKYDEIRSLCKKRSSTLSRIIVALVDHRTSSTTDIRALAEDIGTRELRGHLQRAYPLAVVATLSPLLGLLGTVFGMIACFDTVAIAGELGDASLLADGISQALVTTAMGLVIAVPSLALYHYFKSRTNVYGLALDEEVGELIRKWFLADKEQAGV